MITGLPTELNDLAIALGILEVPAGGDPAAATPSDTWFGAPGTHLARALTDPDQRAALLRLVDQLLNNTPSIDRPAIPGADNEQWVPIVTAEAGQAPRTGLYGVITPRDDGSVDLALAGLVTRAGPPDLRLAARFPLVRISDGVPAAFLAGTADGTIDVELELDFGTPDPSAVIPLESIVAGVAIHTEPGRLPDLTVRLRMPPDGDAGDLVLDSSQELGEQTIDVLVGLISAAADGTPELGHLLALLGLGDATNLPTLSIEQLVAVGRDAVWDWLRELVDHAANPSAISAWFSHLAALIGVTTTGTGTTANPLSMCIDAGPVQTCVLVEVDRTGPAPVITPKLSVVAPAPAGFGPGGSAQVEAEIIRIDVGADPSVGLAPRLSALATLGDPAGATSGATPLLADDIAGIGPSRVQAARIGLAVNAGAGVELIVEAVDVDLGDTHFDSLDLTDTDAVLDAGGAVLDTVVADILASLGDTPAARAAFTLVGLSRPVGLSPAEWPHALALADLFADPLEALRGYHLTVLDAGDWGRLAAEVAALIRADDALDGVVAGDGSAEVPWRLPLFDTAAGHVDVLAWKTVSDHGTRLHIGADIAPPPIELGAATDPKLTLHVRADLVSARLAATDLSPASIDLVGLGSIAATLRFGDDLGIAAGPVRLAASHIDAGVAWDRLNGLAPSLSFVSPQMVLGGVAHDVPLPRWDVDERRFAWDGEIPWELLEQLLITVARELGNALRSAPQALGWSAGSLRHLPAVPPTPGRPALPGSTIGLEQIVNDPLRSLGDWLVDMLQSSQGQEWARQILGWLSDAISPITDDVSALRGVGSDAAPWALPLLAGGRAELVASLGDVAAAVGTGPRIPPLLRSFVDSDPVTALGLADVANTIEQARTKLGDIDSLLTGRGDLTAGLSALVTRLVGTDGIAAAASQHAIAGATQLTLDDIGHLASIASFDPSQHLAGGPPPSGRIFVRTDIESADDWPDVDPTRVVDLTESLPAAAFDLDAVRGSGPWFVVLPSRAVAATAGGEADGHAELAARLRRVVDAIRSTRTDGAALALVAHGTVGHVARAVTAQPAAGITHLTTIATPHAGGNGDWDDVLSGDIVRVLQSLRGLAGVAAGELPEADIVLGALGDLIDGAQNSGGGAVRSLDLGDIAPPSGVPAIPGSVNVTTVAASFSQSFVDKAIAMISITALDHAAALGQELAGEAVRGGLAAGLRFQPVVPTGGAGELRVGVNVRIDPGRLAGDLRAAVADLVDDVVDDPPPEGAPPGGPRVVVEATVDRGNGWLLGGPGTGAPRGSARCRRVQFTAVAGVGTGVSSGRIDLVDASVFGLTRSTWTLRIGAGGVDASGVAFPTHFAPEERVLLGEVVAAFGVVPASGQLRAFADLLVALGIGRIGPDGRLALEIDPLERALERPASVLTDLSAAGADAAASALARLGGATTSAGRNARFDLGAGVELALELPSADGSWSVNATAPAAGVGLGGGLRLGGSITLDSSGHVVGTLEVQSTSSGASRQPVFVVTVDSEASPIGSATVELRDADGVTAETIALLPTPDTSKLVDMIGSVAPAALVRLALGFARDQLPAVGTVIAALGLGATDEPVRLPARLLADPAGWFLDRATFGTSDGRIAPSSVGALVDAVAALLPGSAPAGAIDLPWGLRLAAVPTSSGSGLDIGLSWPAPIPTAHVLIGGSASLTLDSTGSVSSTLGVTLDLPDTASAAAPPVGGLDIAVSTSAPTPSVAIRVGTTTVPILPSTAGLGSLAGAAAQRALPMVLDALATVDVGGVAIGDAVAALGDALALRAGTAPDRTFSATELTAFASDPVGELSTRLTANVPAALTALDALLDPVVPGTIAVAGSVLTLDASAHLRVRLDLSALPGGPPKVCVEAIDVVPTAGLAVNAEVCIDDSIRLAAASVEVTDRDLLAGLLPAVGFEAGSDSATPAGRLELGLWFDEPTVADRQALIVIADLATGVSIVCRTDDPAVADDTDLVNCAAALVTRVLVPRALDVVLAIDEVETLLDQTLDAGVTIGQAMVTAGVLEVDGGGFRLDPGLLDPAALGNRILRSIVVAAQTLVGELPIPALAPMTFSIASDTSDGFTVFGVGLSIPQGEQVELISTDAVRISLEVDGRWVERADPGGGDGVQLLLLAVPGAGDVELRPWFQIRGVGLRFDRADDTQLVDLGLSIRSIGVHGWYERALGLTAPEQGGGHFELDGLALPLGDAGGNAVASSFLSGDESGDPTDLAPAFSPSLSVYSLGAGAEVDLRAGEGDGPWWLPIQRAFGPLYVDQVGLGVGRDGGEIENISFLIDGGASLAGLTMQVDDLEMIVPWATPLNPATWQVDLAGLAIGFESSGISVAGGLRKFLRNGEPDYVGMLSVKFSVYGATAIGGYGVFTAPTGDTYPSFFLFAAINAPIGGPPAFFITGLGGGMGLNRRLIAPTDVTDVPDFPLVAALDPTSDLATDPMGALDRLGETFPPERGAIWFAAGLNFTSFALVETTAVLTVEIHDGLEINLFGLSRLTLPPAPLPTMAQVELALHARFSSREAVLSVVAQLTDNSWIINESVRLTGGFAFVIWFNDGQFVLTLGGYGPAFTKPDRFPDVPRLGFAWEPGGGVVVKGGGYFALTASCVMAGGALEVAYNSGSIWARLYISLDFYVSWDPFHYDVRFHVEVGAGVRWKTFLGTLKLSFNFSVSVHVLGPKLRGSATLDLDVTSVTVRFGPSGATNSKTRIGWSKFLDTYLLEPPSADTPERHVLTASVADGQLQEDVRGNSESEADADNAADGTFERPWQVLPEFALTVQTRAANQKVFGASVPSDVSSRTLDLGPMGTKSVQSELIVAFKMNFIEPITDRFERNAILGYVPEAIWKVLPEETEGAAKTIHTATGLHLRAGVTFYAPAIEVSVVDVRISDNIHLLPFLVEKAEAGRSRFAGLRDANLFYVGRVFGDLASEAADAFDRIDAVTRLSVDPDTDRLVGNELRVDRLAPPRFADLSAGMAETSRPKVTAADVVTTVPPVVVDVAARPPRLVGLASVASAGSTASKSGDLLGVAADTTTVRRSRAQRVPAPELDATRRAVGAVAGADLRLAGSAVARVGKTVASVGVSPLSGFAGGRGERVRRLGVDQAFRETASKADRALAGRGHSIRSGDGHVWNVPQTDYVGPGSDAVLAVSGSAPTRVVVIDSGEEVVSDTTLTQAGKVALGPTAHRVGIVGGAPVGGAFRGWLDDDSVLQIAPDTYLAPGAVITARSAATRRRGARVDVALRRADDAITGADSINTTISTQAGAIESIVLVFDGTGESTDASPRFVIAGAQRRNDIPDRVVAVGDHTVLVVAVKTGKEPIAVAVVPPTGQRLGGVVGSTLGSSAIVDEVGAGGIAALSPGGLAASGTASSKVSWSPA